MPFDPAVALQVQSPNVDLAKPLNTLAQFRLSSAHANVTEQESFLKGKKINALRMYDEASRRGDDEGIVKAIGEVSGADPEAGKILQASHQMGRQIKAQNRFGETGNSGDVQAFPEVAQHVAQTAAITDTNKRQQQLHRLDVGGRSMEGYIRSPSTDTWNAALDTMEKEGGYHPKELAPFRNKPNDIHAQQMRAAGMKAREHMDASGEAAGNQPTKFEPTQSIGVPNLMFNKTPVGDQSSAPAAKTPGQKAAEKSKEYGEVPEIKIGDTGGNQPGVIKQGADPVLMHAKQAANEYYSKTIQPAADASTKAAGELGTIQNVLEKGQVTPGITANIREIAAGAIYEITRSQELAQSLTGIRPEQAEASNKSSVRLGFSLAKSEVGTREAVQTIQYAFAANPNLKMSKEGDLMVTKLLTAGTQWNIDRAKYANAFLQKNGHLVGFDSWWDNTHPVAQYTSAVMPYQFPEDPKSLKNGVTYEWTQNGVSIKGKYNAETGGIDAEAGKK